MCLLFNPKHMPKLHIDIETYSSVELKTAGTYNYINSPDFEILLIAFAVDDEPIEIIETYKKQAEPVKLLKFLSLLNNPKYELHAHNATFERLAINKYFKINLKVDRWYCSMIKAAYCGLPLSLDQVSKALNLGDKAKKKRYLINKLLL